MFDEATAERAKLNSFPWPPHTMSTVNRSCEFLQLEIGGIPFVEALDNVKEICGPIVNSSNKTITVRNMDLPLINGYKMLGKYVRECWENENGEPFYFMDWTKMMV